MRRRATTWFSALIVLTLVASACSSTDDATPESTVAATEATTSTAAPTTTTPVSTTSTTEPVPALEEIGFDPEPGTTTLLRYLGDARASRDGGETWFFAETGLQLEPGDRVQVAAGGITIILFPDDTRIRLEGFAEFELIRAEFDPTTGAKWIVGRLWDGSALVSTLPLATPDSLLQLWSMSTFIDLPYDAARASSPDSAGEFPEGDRISFAAVMREDTDGEVLINYPDSVLPIFYALELIDGELVLVATTPSADEITEFRLPFRDSISDELDLERVLDVVATLVDQNRSATSPLDVDFLGYSMLEQGAFSENQVLFAVFETTDLGEYLLEDEADRLDFTNYARGHRYLQRHSYTFHYYETIPDVFAPAILMLISEYNLGCDITSGLGCTPPAGCNTATGDGCAFVSGCNVITRSGCARARLKCVTHIPCVGGDCHWWQRIAKITTTCRPDIRTFCDPNVPGDCDRFVASDPDASGAGEDGQQVLAATTQVNLGLMQGLTDETSIQVSIAQDAARAGQPLMDVNDPTSCAGFVAADYWQAQVSAANGGYDDFDDEDIEWCTCRATVPPGYPPPPPWMDMTYRCFCDESIRYDD